MVQDQVEGAAQTVVGKVQDAVGSLQQTYGQTIDNVRTAVISQPINGLLIAGAIGFVLGALWNRDRA
jgi:ElaB/YqjD/DUF883 family membrane-anchored ribosome-binding protein